MSYTMLIICVAAIVFAIWFAIKTKINLGFPSLIMAYLIGYFGLGLTISQVFSGWSLSLLRTFTCACAMFFFIRKNGAIGLLGRKLLYATRNIPWAINLVLFLIGAIMSFLGTDTPSVMALICPIAFSLVSETGIHPIALVLSLGLGAASLSLVPWAFNGLTITSTLEQYFDADYVYTMVSKTAAGYFIINLVIIVFYTFITGSFKAKKVNLEKPEAFNKEQITSMWCTFVPVAISVFFAIAKAFIGTPFFVKMQGFCALPVLACFSVCIQVLLKLGDPKECIAKGIPWGIVMLVGGMGCLVSVVQKAGLPEFIAQIVSANLPTFLILPLLTLCGGIMSVFAGATTTVFSLLMAIAVPLCEVTSLTPTQCCAAILAGSMVTAIAPFSTGGASMLGYCDIKEWLENDKLFKTELICAVLALVVSMVFSFAGLLPK